MRQIFSRIFAACGREIRKGLPAGKTGINPKGDVTKYFDSHINRLIINSLARHVRFRAVIISEELKKPLEINRSSKGPLHYIIIDPVDGSDNYMARTPFVALAIAVFDEGLEPVYSFAGNYYTGDAMYADKEALYFNGRRIRRPFIKPPKKLLLLSVTGTRAKAPSEFTGLVNDFDIIRSFGATAGEMLYVVKGEAKAFVDLRGKLTLENFAPFFLAAKHAGLKLADETGKKITLSSLSMTRGYKIVFCGPAALNRIVSRAKKI